MPEITTVRELRRSQILAAARELVVEEGLQALTFGALEQRLDFSRGVITYHFKNKDDLVYGLLDAAVAEIDAAAHAALKRSMSGEEKIRAMLEAMVAGFLGHAAGGQVLLSFWGRLRADGRAAEVNADLYERYRRDTARLVLEGQAAGDFRADADPAAVAAVIVGLVIGICVQAYFRKGDVDIAAAVDEAALSVIARLRPELA